MPKSSAPPSRTTIMVGAACAIAGILAGSLGAIAAGGGSNDEQVKSCHAIIDTMTGVITDSGQVFSAIGDGNAARARAAIDTALESSNAATPVVRAERPTCYDER